MQVNVTEKGDLFVILFMKVLEMASSKLFSSDDGSFKAKLNGMHSSADSHHKHDPNYLFISIHYDYCTFAFVQVHVTVKTILQRKLTRIFTCVRRKYTTSQKEEKRAAFFFQFCR